MKTKQFDTHEDWLEARKTGFGIGASTVASILGASSYRTPWDVWAGFHAPDELPAGNVAQLQRGHLLERHILQQYRDENDVAVTHFDRTICYHAKEDWARFSPDGIRSDGGIVEVKTVRNGWEWRDAPVIIESADELEYLPRMAYGIQAYWQLLVSGAPFCDLVVLPLSHELAAVADALAMSDWPEALAIVANNVTITVVRIMADTRFQARLGSKVAAWREEHLVGAAEPPASGANASAYHGRVPKQGMAQAQDDDAIMRAAAALDRWRKKEAHARRQVKTGTGILKQAMQKVEGVASESRSAKWKRHGKGMRLVLDGFTHRNLELTDEAFPTLPILNAEGEDDGRSSTTS